jgi:hypothetical protein
MFPGCDNWPSLGMTGVCSECIRDPAKVVKVADLMYENEREYRDETSAEGAGQPSRGIAAEPGARVLEEEPQPAPSPEVRTEHAPGPGLDDKTAARHLYFSSLSYIGAGYPREVPIGDDWYLRVMPFNPKLEHRTEQGSDLVATLARWICQEDDNRRDSVGRSRVDHACAECMPGGEIVQPGFRCALHLAREIEARRTSDATFCGFCAAADPVVGECPRHPRTGNEDVRTTDAQLPPLPSDPTGMRQLTISRAVEWVEAVMRSYPDSSLPDQLRAVMKACKGGENPAVVDRLIRERRSAWVRTADGKRCPACDALVDPDVAPYADGRTPQGKDEK